MTRWAPAGALFLLLLVVLLARMPARLLPALLPVDQLMLQGVSGTLWHGKASRSLLRTRAGYLQLGEVQWQLRPWSLALLAPTLAIHSQWGEQRITGTVTMHGLQDIELQQVEASFNAELLRQVAPVAVEGRFSLLANQLRVRNGMPAGGEGRLVWEYGAWAAPQGRLPLGSYALEFQQADPDAAVTGEVLTLAGPVLAEGTVSLAGRAYALDLMIRAERGLDPALQRALSLMARPRGDAFQLQLKGALRAPD